MKNKDDKENEEKLMALIRKRDENLKGTLKGEGISVFASVEEALENAHKNLKNKESVLRNGSN